MTAPIVLIVGAGDYIGAAIARRFAQGGFVVCLARRNGDKLTSLVNEIAASGGVAYKFFNLAKMNWRMTYNSAVCKWLSARARCICRRLRLYTSSAKWRACIYWGVDLRQRLV